MPKRKKISKPRGEKRPAIRRNRKTIHVTPRKLLGWQIVYGDDTFRVARKEDAVSLGILVAQLVSAEFSVSLYIHGRNGKVQEERTYTRTDDPPKTPG